jgi:hypothetical protein
MNIDYIVNEILKISKSERTLSKQKFVDKTDFEKSANNFIGSIKSKLVFLKLKSLDFSEDKSEQPYQNWKIIFEIIFNLVDDYVDDEAYSNGSVYIYPSKKFYDDVTKESNAKLGAIPTWNETRTVGTITGKARAY